MQRIVLFRFHKNLRACRNHIELLRFFNPGLPVYGLYGGREWLAGHFQRGLSGLLDGFYTARGERRLWKWQNGDLLVRRWFQEVGHQIGFDMLHVVEWDLVLLDSITNLYRHIPAGGIGLTALRPLREMELVWHWTTAEPHKSEWRELLAHVRQTYGYQGEPQFCLGPGFCLPRAFLEGYARLQVPELAHDELRLPLYGQVLGHELYRTGFCPGLPPKGMRVFNCARQPIRPQVVQAELGRADGHRAFHPVRFALRV